MNDFPDTNNIQKKLAVCAHVPKVLHRARCLAGLAGWRLKREVNNIAKAWRRPRDTANVVTFWTTSRGQGQMWLCPFLFANLI